MERKKPRTIRDWFSLGKFFMKRKKYREAVKCFSKALGMNPTPEERYHVLAEKAIVFCAMRDFANSLKYFDIALEIDPEQPGAYLGKGGVYGSMGEYDKALMFLDKATEKDDKISITWKWKADNLIQLEKYEEALGCLNKATKIKPKDSRSWYLKAVTLAYLERIKEAKKAVKKSLKLEPMNAKATKLMFDLDKHEPSKIKALMLPILKKLKPEPMVEEGTKKKPKFLENAEHNPYLVSVVFGKPIVHEIISGGGSVSSEYQVKPSCPHCFSEIFKKLGTKKKEILIVDCLSCKKRYFAWRNELGF